MSSARMEISSGTITVRFFRVPAVTAAMRVGFTDQVLEVGFGNVVPLGQLLHAGSQSGFEKDLGTTDAHRVGPLAQQSLQALSFVRNRAPYITSN